MKTIFLRLFRRFMDLEASSGILLFASSVAALAWGNSGAQRGYHAILEQPILKLSILHWINDGLMTLFFLVVGLEIKREFTQGALANRPQALLPIVAALGGMIVPALIYCAFNWKTPYLHGWGVPMATDIAFSLGVLSLLGKRVPFALKVFLTAFAIVDDLGAVLVIALFYTDDIVWLNLIYATAALCALAFAFKKFAQFRIVIGLLVAFGSLAWLLFLRSGVHPAILGVLLALILPKRAGYRIETSLHPWVAFGILPLFALANAGVSLSGNLGANSVGLGIIFGLVFGKPIGIMLFSWIVVRFGYAALPARASWRQLYGVATLGGIGFTMALFIAGLAFRNAGTTDAAKIGILTASVVSGLIGGFILFLSSSQTTPSG